MNKKQLENILHHIQAGELQGELDRGRAVFAKASRDSMHRQFYSGKWARLKVERDRNNVEISWEFEAGFKENEFWVQGSLTEIDFIPDVSRRANEAIYSGDGHGKLSLELHEGCAYLLSFWFLKNGCSESDLSRSDSLRKYVDMVEFQVAIPISDERRDLFKKAVSLDLYPEERIRHQTKTLLNKVDAFDEVHEEGISRIKAKRLSRKEEKRQIERFTAQVELMKEEFGL